MISIYQNLKKTLLQKLFLCFLVIIYALNSTLCIAFDDENNNIPQDIIRFAYKKGYETPKRIWYLSNTCIKNTIYTDIFYTQKKDNKQYRYILYNEKQMRFATKSEQLRYIENRYF